MVQRKIVGFSHIAFDIPGVDQSNEWSEKVSDKVYNNL